MPDRSTLDQLPNETLISVFDRLSIMLFVIDERFHVRYWNSAAHRVLGWTSDETAGHLIVGVPSHERAEVFDLFRRALNGAENLRNEMSWVKKDGIAIPVELFLMPLRSLEAKESYLLGALVDVTERRRIQMTANAQKMDAVSRLAGAVAHDFNNLLANVDGYAREILWRHEPRRSLESIAGLPESALSAEFGSVTDEDYKDAERIVDQANRAAVLTSQLTTISGGTHRRPPKTVNVADVIDRMSSTLRGLLGADIDLSIAIAEGVAFALCDAVDLEQVLTHLIINARLSMPQGGSVHIVAEHCRRPELFGSSLSPAASTQVAISITDSGSGMDQNTLSHVFEPFFSITGRKGGLGLSLAYNIVRRHGGEIEARSSLGVGSTFTIYLLSATEDNEPSSVPVTQVPDFRGSETILVVEDKAPIRHLISTTLRARGYNVLMATGAAEALALYKLDPVSIQLLLTDVIMPRGVSGSELSGELTALRPTLKTLYFSSHFDSTLQEKGFLTQGVPFIQKPFTPEALAKKVRETLDAKPSGQ